MNFKFSVLNVELGSRLNIQNSLLGTHSVFISKENMLT